MSETKGTEHKVRRQVALMAVFKRFKTVWPRAFAPSVCADLLDTWLDALRGVDTDLLELAGKEFLRAQQSPYPPKPWEFAKAARKLQAEQHGNTIHTPTTTTAQVTEWSWMDPWSHRIAYVTRRDTHWTVGGFSGPAYVEWLTLDDWKREALCASLQHEYPVTSNPRAA